MTLGRFPSPMAPKCRNYQILADDAIENTLNNPTYFLRDEDLQSWNGIEEQVCHLKGRQSSQVHQVGSHSASLCPNLLKLQNPLVNSPWNCSLECCWQFSKSSPLAEEGSKSEKLHSQSQNKTHFSLQMLLVLVYWLPGSHKTHWMCLLWVPGYILSCPGKNNCSVETVSLIHASGTIL